ncbi:hypothetical protein ARMSODRAFT_628886 [Armillaria solidipes]|uniref:Uncharacterized protein n=1 Tax=Armillaria solidipes TaxID=1076256 RepID=A0A2H3BR33_9AGAR|nr:hypothetical protein ARMSODRAFT_628886 [Armillaria solidipes]
MIIPLLWISFHFCAYALWGSLLCSMQKICLAWADRMIYYPHVYFVVTTIVYASLEWR